MDEAATTKLDVVLFPWLAYMIPYLDLGKRLAARGHAVTFLSTPRNVARLPPVPEHLSPHLRFVALPMPAVDGLPEGAESTADVPPEQNELIKRAADGHAAPFAAFLADAIAGGRRPDWLIIDFCHHWIPPIANEHRVPCAAFLIVQATTIAFLGPRWAHAAHPRTALEDFVVPPEWCPSWPPAVAYRRHEAAWAVGAFQRNASGVSDMDHTWEIIERLRFVADLLPAGFEDRTRGRGLVWSGWVPQVAGLAHGAVGAFLTHCGWGPTIESLVFGRPLVMLPFVVDQGLIARTMAERGVGVEVARDEGDGSFGRECVAAAVRRVMVEEEGKVFESNAARLKEALGDQRRQDQYMNELEGFLKRCNDGTC